MRSSLHDGSPRCTLKLVTRPKLKLMFVHVPKAGGTSVNSALFQTFGDRLYTDYGDGPADPAAPTNFDPEGYLEGVLSSGYPWLAGKDAVTGHFWARKYDGVDCGARATILRHPVARAISLHAFWTARKGLPGLRDNVVRRYLVEHQLDFFAFARIPSVNRFYVDHMFRDVDMRSFDYVGDQDHMLRNWVSVTKRLGLSTPKVVDNETKSLAPSYPERAREILEDKVTMARLNDIFAADLRFYECWADV
jgi:hypothetical protein